MTKKHDIFTVDRNKKAPSSHKDKRYILDIEIIQQLGETIQ